MNFASKARMKTLPRISDDRQDEDRKGSFEASPDSSNGAGDASPEILLVSQFFWPEPIGTPAYVTDAAKWFAEQGRPVTVLTGRPYYPDFRIRQGYERGQRDREIVEGVRVLRLPTIVPTGGGAAGRIVSEANFFVRSVLKLLTRKLRGSGSVISFCPSILTVLAGAMAVRRGGRHVAIVHDIQSGLAGGLGMVRSSIFLKLMRFVETIVLNRADGVIVLSDRMKGVLVAQGVRTRIEVVPLWVDQDKIYPIARQPGRPPTVIYSGNLGLKQGVAQLLDLAEELKSRRPEIRILIRGAGSQEGLLKNQANERALTNVSFGPLLPLEELNEGLSEGDVHLLPQEPRTADFAVPSKVYNIMAAGRPIIATAMPGSTLSTLQAESGALLCVPPNDARPFADAIISLFDDLEKWTEMSAKGRSYVEENYSRNLILSVLSECLEGRYSRGMNRNG